MAKTKGRPPLKPRIAALETRIGELEELVASNHRQALLSVELIQEARQRIAALSDSTYQPLFERWPGNGSS